MIATILAATAFSPPHSFEARDGQFWLDGKPFVIRSGEMHYPRVPDAYWKDRMVKARAMGLNTICTYVFWNLHESKPGKWDFAGNLDFVRFVKTAQETGLKVILRPGPYICTEEDFGGFPSWLLKDRTLQVRSRDPRYLAAVKAYFNKIGPMIRPLLIQNGGPVIMTQVENEYGSFGSDHWYMNWVKDTLRASGISGQLSTSDGPGQGMLNGGTLPDVPATVNFGGGAPGAFAELEKFRPGSPRMIGEYWCGWFDHWGKPHTGTSAASHLPDIEWCLDNNVSFNLYMFHGGTNFGFMQGANGSDHDYDLDTTSYDYDSPVDESGRITPKYEAFRKAIEKHLGEPLPPVPPTPSTITIPLAKLTQEGYLLGRLPKPIPAHEPRTFEELDQAHGLVLYRTETKLAGPQTITFKRLNDYGIIYVNGVYAGELDRRKGQTSLDLKLPSGGAVIDVLVECHARINFGGALVNERKGLVGEVKLGDQILTNWKHYGYPLIAAPHGVAKGVCSYGPTVYRGTLNVEKPGDTFLDTRNWDKGFVWVNGHNLGRFWHIGPQQTLFVPGPWLKAGANEIVILDEGEKVDQPSITGLAKPILNQAKQDSALLHRQAGEKLDLSHTPSFETIKMEDSTKARTFMFPQAQHGRYLAIEVTNSFGDGPFASLAEIWAVDAKSSQLPRDGWKVIYADSEETNEENGSASNVIDNQPTTYWHTEFSQDTPELPHFLVIDFGKDIDLSGIRLLPRQVGHNGRIETARLSISSQLFPGLKPTK